MTSETRGKYKRKIEPLVNQMKRIRSEPDMLKEASSLADFADRDEELNGPNTLSSLCKVVCKAIERDHMDVSLINASVALKDVSRRLK